MLQFIGKLPHPYRLATLEGDASLAGLWVFKDDLTRERVLGAIAAVDPGIIAIEAVEAYLAKKDDGARRAKAARDAYESDAAIASRSSARTRASTGRTKFRSCRSGTSSRTWASSCPPCKRSFEVGPRGQSRNDMFKRGTTKTHRPIVRFDLCIKCTLCWLDCPDACFDPTDDGLYDVNYEVCVGCHKCADVCPVPECIVMVDELRATDDNSPWEHYKKDPVELHRVGRGDEGHRARQLPARDRHGQGDSRARTCR